MPSYEWKPYPPSVDEVRAIGGTAHYWVRGWNFNRPVTAEVVVSTRAKPLENFITVWRIGDNLVQIPATDPRFSQFEPRLNWKPLEWAGPIPEPGFD